MNRYQRCLNHGTKKNIKLYPLEKGNSFYKRRKLFRKGIKLLDKGAFDIEDLD